jgi:hypothetical protein
MNRDVPAYQCRQRRSLNSPHGSWSGLRTSIDVIPRKHENFEFDAGNFTDGFRFDPRLKLFEFTLKNRTTERLVF